MDTFNINGYPGYPWVNLTSGHPCWHPGHYDFIDLCDPFESPAAAVA